MAEQEVRIKAYETLLAQPIEALAQQYESQHQPLFPEDFLYGLPALDKYREWYRSVFVPMMNNAGDEGKLLWRAISKVNLVENPDVLVQSLAVLSVWFFPEAQNTLSTIALLVILRKLAAEHKE